MSEESPTTTDAVETQDVQSDSVELGDNGKKALEAERKRASAAEREAKALKARLDEIDEAQKTDAEKFADRIAKAEAEALTVPAKVADALKAHLVALHEISDEDAELFLTASDPEVLLKQVTRLVGQTGKRKNTNTVPREGATTEAGNTDEAAFARDLFGG